MDSKADKQFPLSPYHYAAGNPVMMQDTDGDLFFLAAALLLKGAKVAKGVKIAVGAVASMMSNKKQISKAFKGDFLKGLGTMLGYGAVGAVGAGVGAFAQKAAGLKAFLTGASLNVGFEGATGQFSGAGVNAWGRIAGSAITGGFSALAGKNFGDAFAKGGEIAAKKAGIKIPEAAADLKFEVAEPLIENGVATAMFDKLKAKKQMFSWYSMGQYGLKGLENVGAKLNTNDGHTNFRSGLGYFFAGAAGGVITNGVVKGVTNMAPSEKLAGLKSIAAPLLGYAAGNFTQNSINFMTKKDRISFAWTDVYNDGIKSVFKVDFFTGGGMMGYSRFNRLF